MSSKPKTYQKPKADHPWRQYKDKKVSVVETLAEEVTGIIPVSEWIKELSETYKNQEITLSVSFEGTRTHKLTNLPQSKQAAWIAGFLKRNYGR